MYLRQKCWNEWLFRYFSTSKNGSWENFKFRVGKVSLDVFPLSLVWITDDLISCYGSCSNTYFILLEIWTYRDSVMGKILSLCIGILFQMVSHKCFVCDRLCALLLFFRLCGACWYFTLTFIIATYKVIRTFIVTICTLS